MQLLAVRRWLLVTLVLHICQADILADETAEQPKIVVWDRFRGANGMGTTDDKDVPLTFGAKEKMIWKVALPGAGGMCYWQKPLNSTRTDLAGHRVGQSRRGK